MKRRGLCFIIGGFFYIAINLFFCSRLLVYADEVEDQVDQINEDLEEEYGYLSFIEEDQENTDKVLSDTYTLIKKVDQDIEAGTKGNRSMPINSYDSNNSWLFNEVYYYDSDHRAQLTDQSGNWSYQYCYWFSYDDFDDQTQTLVAEYANAVSWQYLQFDGGYVVIPVDPTVNDFSVFETRNQGICKYWVTSYGFPSENRGIYWWVPDPTPTPDPDPSPTPTPDPDPSPTPTPEGDITVNIDPEFKIMVIFVGGMISGLLVGRMLLGFVK